MASLVPHCKSMHRMRSLITDRFTTRPDLVRFGGQSPTEPRAIIMKPRLERDGVYSRNAASSPRLRWTHGEMVREALAGEPGGGAPHGDPRNEAARDRERN